MTGPSILDALAASEELTPAGMNTLWGTSTTIDRFLAQRDDATDYIITNARTSRNAATRAARLAATTDPGELSAPLNGPTEQRAAARNPHTPTSALQAIWDSGGRLQGAHLARNANTPATIVDDILAGDDPNMKAITSSSTRNGAKVGSILNAHPRLAERLAQICSGSGARILLEMPDLPDGAATIALGRHHLAATARTAAENPWIAATHCKTSKQTAARATMIETLGLPANHTTGDLEAALTQAAGADRGIGRLLSLGSASINRWLVAHHPNETVAKGLCLHYTNFDTAPDLYALLADKGGRDISKIIIAGAGATRTQFAAEHSQTLEHELVRKQMSPPQLQLDAWDAIDDLGDNEKAWKLAVGLWSSSSVPVGDVATCALALAS